MVLCKESDATGKLTDASTRFPKQLCLWSHQVGRQIMYSKARVSENHQVDLGLYNIILVAYLCFLSPAYLWFLQTTKPWNCWFWQCYSLGIHMIKRLETKPKI